MRKIILLVLALALLLCACTPAAQPGETTTASDMAAFMRDGLAFDVSDLLHFLTNGQPPALEAAVMENLAALGIDPARVALQFDDPVPGSVKLPFANPSEADMARLDINKLAEHIAGQVAAEFEARGMDSTAPVATTAGAAGTTTTKASTSVAAKSTGAGTTTSQKATTSAKAAEKYSFPATLDMATVRKDPNYQGSEYFMVPPDNAKPVYVETILSNGDKYLWVKPPYDKSNPLVLTAGVYRINQNSATLMDTYNEKQDQYGNVVNIYLLDVNDVVNGKIFATGIKYTNGYGNSYFTRGGTWYEIGKLKVGDIPDNHLIVNLADFRP